MRNCTGSMCKSAAAISSINDSLAKERATSPGARRLTGPKRSLIGLHPRHQRRRALLVFELVHFAATCAVPLEFPPAVGFHTDLTAKQADAFRRPKKR